MTVHLTPAWKHGAEGARRARNRSSASGRLCILLLSVGLVAVAALAKHSFGLPPSNASHWISQTCKIGESRRVDSPRITVRRVLVVVLRSDQPRPQVIAVREYDQPPVATPDFFSPTSLRSPPKSL
jgi:hypothetical protein